MRTISGSKLRTQARHAAMVVAVFAGAAVCLRGAARIPPGVAGLPPSVAPAAVAKPAAGAPTAAASAASAAACADCLKARYWQIDPLDYEKSGDASFPETPFLQDRLDLGLAFSGGGTRAATAELGQLRGLQRLGWLQKVRYVSAVSGGGWAAIPFVYSKLPLDDFLGSYQPPDQLNLEQVKTVAHGGLGLAIAKSSLVSGSIREGTAIYLNIRERLQEAPNPLLQEIVWLTNRVRREGGRDDKTYARMLGSIFVSDTLVAKDAAKNLFSWNTATLDEMMRLNPGKLPLNFVTPHGMTAPGQPASGTAGSVAGGATAATASASASAAAAAAAGPDRPFLIAGGTLVSVRKDYDYPLLMPVEYTPMYVGVRQTFGVFGGSYVWPWAYDPLAIGPATPDPAAATPGGGVIDVKVDFTQRAFTLADVAASTGAAPEIPALQGFGLDLDAQFKERLAIAAQYFPHFKHYGIHDPARVTLTEAIPHGDGGGIENLGVMPLLARHVHNILVFNNTSEPCVDNNSDMQALFLPSSKPDATSDTRGDQVFEAFRWDEVKNAINGLREAGLPQIYCGVDWAVMKNERYNIRAYDHLNICFIYNASAAEWEKLLGRSPGLLEFFKDPKAAAAAAPGDVCRAGGTAAAAKALQNFPYFATFEQNKPHLIQLTVPQVNLFSNLTAWIISNESSVKKIREAMKDLHLPCPAGMACSQD